MNYYNRKQLTRRFLFFADLQLCFYREKKLNGVKEERCKRRNKVNDLILYFADYSAHKWNSKKMIESLMNEQYFKRMNYF